VNFNPSSYVPDGDAAGVWESVKREHGQAVVVKLQPNAVARVAPSAARVPAATAAVYEPAARGAVGVQASVADASSYVMLPDTEAPDASRTVSVLAEIAAGSRGRDSVAWTDVTNAVSPADGVVCVTANDALAVFTTPST
jgi:hypothetical protein